MVTQFSTNYPILQRVILGFVASFLFFFLVIIRMLIITFFAVRKGAVVKSDTLFATGSVLEIEKNTMYPALEVLLAMVGLLTNLVVAGILYIIYQVLANTGSIMVQVLVQWLAFIYFMLALFNLLPGLPLDGGKILRAVLWKTTNDYDRMTRILSWMGWIIGLGFIVSGIVLTVLTRQWFVGVLLALPGFILQNAATHQRRQAGKQRGKQKQKEEPGISASPG
ncbi:MAG: site-2 protease family protein [Dehalococcoidales bacterium]|nr:site-2 protease family protein [Dehalococcoidales bacterium]